MLRRIVQNKAAIAAVSTVVLATTIGGTYAASTAAAKNKVLHGCVNIKSGQLRMVSAPSDCVTKGGPAVRERVVSWNQKGVKGAKGAPGADGADGIDGIDGVDGVDGVDGAVGPRGATGAPGPQGPKGDPGQDGADGLPGVDGADGADGAVGPDGLQGPKGDRGADGEDGEDGVQGPQGIQGEQGIQGPVGPAGPPGGGASLTDGADVTIGKVVAGSVYGITVASTEDYIFDVNWKGAIDQAQVWYTGTNCTGTAYLNDGRGGRGGEVIYGRTLTALADGTLAAPAAATSGYSTSTELAGDGMAYSIKNVGSPCSNHATGTPASGWELETITRAAAGLPAGTGTTFALPLQLS
jgi:hypothetical protein